MADNRERARHTVAGQKYDRIRRNKKDRNSALKDQSISIGERLIVAAMKYAVEIEYNRGAEIRWLIKQGANPDYKSERGGWHAMHFVSYNGSSDGVRALLDKNASVNVSNDDGTTPLHLACASGNRDVASALLDAGAMLNVQSGRRITMTFDPTVLRKPSRWRRCGREEIKETHVARAKFVLRMWLTDDLIVKLVDPRSQFFRQKHEIMIDQGKELGIIWRDTQVWALTPRSYAKEVGIRPGMRLAKVDSLNIRSGGHLQGVIKRTESRSSDKDAKQAKLLFIANANLGWKIIDVDGAPVNTKDELYKRLEQAREDFKLAAAREYESKNPIADESARVFTLTLVDLYDYKSPVATPLHTAALHGDSLMVALLIGHGAHLGARDGDRRVPLHWAAISASRPTIQLLLKAGAWPMACDRWGERPVEVAGSPEVRKMLDEVDPRRNISMSYQRPVLYTVPARLRFATAAALSVLAPLIDLASGIVMLQEGLPGAQTVIFLSLLPSLVLAALPGQTLRGRAATLFQLRLFKEVKQSLEEHRETLGFVSLRVLQTGLESVPVALLEICVALMLLTYRCISTDGDAVDLFDSGCTFESSNIDDGMTDFEKGMIMPYDDYPGEGCGNVEGLDDEDFTADDMCCGCGGGDSTAEIVGVPHPMLFVGAICAVINASVTVSYASSEAAQRLVDDLGDTTDVKRNPIVDLQRFTQLSEELAELQASNEGRVFLRMFEVYQRIVLRTQLARYPPLHLKEDRDSLHDLREDLRMASNDEGLNDLEMKTDRDAASHRLFDKLRRLDRRHRAEAATVFAASSSGTLRDVGLAHRENLAMAREDKDWEGDPRTAHLQLIDRELFASLSNGFLRAFRHVAEILARVVVVADLATKITIDMSAFVVALYVGAYLLVGRGYFIGYRLEEQPRLYFWPYNGIPSRLPCSKECLTTRFFACVPMLLQQHPDDPPPRGLQIFFSCLTQKARWYVFRLNFTLVPSPLDVFCKWPCLPVYHVFNAISRLVLEDLVHVWVALFTDGVWSSPRARTAALVVSWLESMVVMFLIEAETERVADDVVRGISIFYLAAKGTEVVPALYDQLPQHWRAKVRERRHFIWMLLRNQLARLEKLSCSQRCLQRCQTLMRRDAQKERDRRNSIAPDPEPRLRIEYSQAKTPAVPRDGHEESHLAPPAQLPDARVRLDHVHGFSRRDAGEAGGSNLLFVDSRIMYSSGGIVIFDGCAAADSASSAQSFFLGHDQEVCCLAACPSTGRASLVASAQRATKIQPPIIYVYDAAQPRLARGGSAYARDAKICITLPRGFNEVLALGFVGKNAEWSLVSVASDDQETIVSVHDIKTGLLRCSAVQRPPKVHALASNDTLFLTVGGRHVTFWEFAEEELRSKAGTCVRVCNMPDHMFSATYLSMGGSSLALTGGSDGGVYLWRSERAECILVVREHTVPVRGLIPLEPDGGAPRYVSADESGRVSHMSFSVADKTFKRAASMRLSTTCGGENSAQGVPAPSKRARRVRYMCRTPATTAAEVIVATEASQILHVDLATAQPRARLLGGNAHGGLGLATALAAHPSEAIYASGAEDRLIAMWSLVPATDLAGRGGTLPPRATAIAPLAPLALWRIAHARLSVPCTALCFSPAVAASELAFGTSDGCVGLFETPKLSSTMGPAADARLVERVPMRTPPDGGEAHAVVAISYSPSGATLAVATEGKYIDLLNPRDPRDPLARLARLEGHTAPPRQMDWNASGELLRSCAADGKRGELLVFEIASASQVEGSELDDTLATAIWATGTVTLGFETLGLHVPGAPASEIASAQRQQRTLLSAPLVVTTDRSGAARLFSYPCSSLRTHENLDKWPRFGDGVRTHAEAARAVWCGESRIITLGERDQMLCTWVVEKGGRSNEAAIRLQRVQRGSACRRKMKLDPGRIGAAGDQPQPAAHAHDTS